MQLKEILADIDYRIVSGSVEIDVSDLIYDSRKVSDGTVFFCMDGAKADGHSFAGEAVKKGAVALITEHDVDVPDSSVTIIQVSSARKALANMSAVFFGYPAKEMKIIGITGTKGKTSTAFMIKNIIEKAGYKCGMIGTVGAFFGDKKVKTGLTTPESYVIHSLFRDMADDGCKYVVMEVSSQSFKLDRTAGIMFDIAVFTNFSPDHIGEGEHADLDEYLRCKQMLFSQCKTGIFNLDDSSSDKFIGNAVCEKKYTYGTSSKADLYADNIVKWSSDGKLGISYDSHGMYEGSFRLEIPGLFNIYNSLAAVSVCYCCGVDMEVVKNVLADVRIPGRVELVHVSDEYSIIIDYAHNEVSTRSVLNTIKEYNPNRIICVYGCGGNRSKLRRYDMGEVTGEIADLCVLTCDNPRDEEIEDINNDIKVGLGKSNGEYVSIPDRTDAIEYAMKNAVKGDVIILLGKGHEDYQEIKGVKHHYSEKEAIMEAAKRIRGDIDVPVLY